MKKITTQKTHYEQINLSLGYINGNFGTDMSAEELASISGYSIFHFHRIFKSITGESVNDYIKNTRLEKASNLLLYNQHKKIETIALECGFATGTGFGGAFKKRFGMTPKDWRKVGFDSFDYAKNESFETIDINPPQNLNMPIMPILYIRTYDYKSNMSEIWNKLSSWSEAMDVYKEPYKFLGLFHTHPSSLPYDNARYLACVNTQADYFRNGEVGRCRIMDGKFAKFSFSCTHEELYKLMHHCYINWLPNSGYELRNFPSYVEYKNPENLLSNDILEVDFFMPINIII